MKIILNKKEVEKLIDFCKNATIKTGLIIEQDSVYGEIVTTLKLIGSEKIVDIMEIRQD